MSSGLINTNVGFKAMKTTLLEEFVLVKNIKLRIEEYVKIV